MTIRRLVVLGVAVLSLAACAPAPAPAPVPMPLPSQPEVQTSQSQPAEPPSSEPAQQGDPAASVKAYGVSSSECEAASTVLQGATTIGLLASSGKVTQAAFEKAYTGASANKLPVDALPAFADLKTASLKVVGLTADEAQQHLGEFSLALGNFTRVTEKICS